MRKIESIQALRAFAAVSVVLCHMSFIPTGGFGVDIFFVISGFLMMRTTRNGLEQYWRKKIVRIIPFYWFMTIVTSIAIKMMPGLFNSYEVSWIYLVKSLLFIPYVHNGIYQPVLGLGYTLNYEMLFYLLFYVSAKTSTKICSWGGRGILCSIAIILMVYMKTLTPPMPFYFWCNVRMLDFVFGIVLYYVFNIFNVESKLKMESRVRNLVSGSIAMFEMVFLWIVPAPQNANGILFVWGISSVILFAAVYIWGYGKHIFGLFTIIGNISFYMYLTHPYIVRLTERLIGKFIGYGIGSFVLMAVIGVLFSILCGYMISSIIEKLQKLVVKGSI